MSDTATTSESPTNQMGTFDEEGTYTPREIVSDDLGMSFADAIDGTMVTVEDGQLVHGTVVKIDKDEVLLDIGYKSEGVILSRELSIRNDVDPSEVVSLGEQVEALVLTKEDKEGRLLLSKKRAQYERAWGDIEAKKEADEVVSGPVIEVVKGGLIVDIGLRGFLPASLVELRRVRDLAPYIGETVHCKIIELDKNRNNVVLSRRAYLEENQKETRDQFLNNLKVGEVREGTISSVVSFGAFVDLGGMDGLIHVSELSWKHVDHPGSVVAVGDPVKVQVLDVDFSRERISLSLKATQQDPWQEFAESHQVEQLVYGRVTKLVQFGAFVQVGEGIEGLVHISEMSAHHVDSPEQVVTPGEELWVKIIDLDLARRRISLSIKQAAEGGELAAEYREHFEVDSAGNWVQGEASAEAEAAWSEYYGEGGEGATEAADAAAPADTADVADSTEATHRGSRRGRHRGSRRGRRGHRLGRCGRDHRRRCRRGGQHRGGRHRGVILVGLTGGIGAGKSTVSAMLAERGAVIVDADRIARDLQSPGSPVLEAMAERFGPQILLDDGRLDRAAVAKIVFNDETALADLNGIVHPAMQSEIQLQIDEQRSTDRVVVLDFPLLGENPRKGLAATIVVDIPVDVAVQRLVEQRGMDEDDARARINSQLSRDERLASATHVIDNGGDRDSLVEQVDALWQQLLALPATADADSDD